MIVSIFALVYAVTAAKILEGPSTRTKVIGPDGSVIDAYAPGGKILLEGDSGPLLQAAPVVLAQPAIAELQPTLEVKNSIEIVPVLSEVSEKAAKLEAREFVPVTEITDETTGTTETLPTTVSLDSEGAYVPDNNSALYDDGSYRPEHY